MLLLLLLLLLVIYSTCRHMVLGHSGCGSRTRRLWHHTRSTRVTSCDALPACYRGRAKNQISRGTSRERDVQPVVVGSRVSR